MQLLEWPFYKTEFLASQGLSSTFVKRFWSKVQITDSCWLWTGCRDNNGYGRIIAGVGNDLPVLAHVGSWLIHRGVRNGLCVLHNCPTGDNPSCVNPAHLWLGTQAQNLADMAKKGRAQRGENHYQAKLTEEDVREIRAACTGWWGQYSFFASKFGISEATVREIVAGEIWRHVIS